MRTLTLARGRLDAALGGITPVLLVLTVLAVFVIVAVLLGMVELLDIDVVAVAIGFVIAIISTFLGAVLGASLVRLRSGWADWPQLESTLVTGLILGFLFEPSLDPVHVLGLGLAGVLAGASKHLLAWRGRHVVNPAAFGAAVVGLTGLALPTWWIGSEPLLAVVVLGALLVAYRAGALGPAALTVLLAAGLTAGALLLVGLPLGQALALPFTSFGFVFLAGIMLTEPQTLPPSRAQR